MSGNKLKWKSETKHLNVPPKGQIIRHNGFCGIIDGISHKRDQNYHTNTVIVVHLAAFIVGDKLACLLYTKIQFEVPKVGKVTWNI